jgi:hypothetical protein
MGYVHVINGSGFTVAFTDAGVKIEPSMDYCISCNDDRLMRDGVYLVCQICHTRQ